MASMTQDGNPGSSGSQENSWRLTTKPTTCEKCNETFSSMTKFNAHRGTCKKYKCPNCTLRFVTKEELKKHAGTHRVLFHCDQCETETFHSQAALDNHKKNAHGVAIKCPHCPQTFSWAHKRDEHVKNCIVSAIGGAKAVKRKYQELVDAASPDLDVAALALKAFETVQEEAQKKLKPPERLSCETCGTSFKDKKSLKRHNQKFHPRSMSSTPPETASGGEKSGCSRDSIISSD